MADIVSKEKRSSIMSKIKGKNTGPEKKVFKELNKLGLKFKKHYCIGPGTTSIDIAFPEKKIAIFIDGDFWHGYNWSVLRKKLKNKFWLEKIQRNIKRDKIITSRLKKEGWMVVRIWEHDINNLKRLCSKITKLKINALKFR